MSSRALRKLQREQDLQRQVAAAKAEQDEAEESDADEDDEIKQPAHVATKPINASDMLENAGEDDSNPDDSDSASVNPEPIPPQTTVSTSSRLLQTSKAKKKKKKGKKKGKEKGVETPQQNDESGDEIDRALKELAAKNAAHNQQEALDALPIAQWEASATKLLAIEAKNLNPVNEMRSLFGNIALEGHDSRSGPRNPRRRDQNLQGGVDLATVLTGRYSAVNKGKELGNLATRRNVFMQGREEWPLATSGGLSMDYAADPESFEKRYSILHNKQYQETQMHFRMIVESMDPQRMIGLLTMYPYHIATLLQVSEIAKHQGDHSVSGDLLERALFSFGRSVHSSFPAALREGTARIGFNSPANRELYLTIWRYIRNLEMRGTWRTAFEWCKVLLQLNTLSDPYGVTLMIDQFALRGRQHEQLIDLSSDEAYGNAWKHLPNIQISLVLAYLRAKKPRDARRQLAIAIHKYPYIVSALTSALDISPLPKSLWAQLPSTDAEKLYTELYVIRTKDLWNTPETSALLVEVAETLDHYSAAIKSSAPAAKLEVSLEEARHIILLDTPALIALLPRRFTMMPTSASDVLPPPDTESEFTARAPSGGSGAGAMQTLFNAAGATAGLTGGVLQRVLNWFSAPAGPEDIGGESEGQVAFRNLQEELGGDVPPEMIEQLLRMHIQEADEGHERITAEGLGLGMAGAWEDHEDDVDRNGVAEDNDSMPELESIPTASSGPTGMSPSSASTSAAPQNPHAAMVEEDLEDEDDLRPRNAHSGPARGILRHVDSDDEDDVDSDGILPHPSQPTHTLFTPASSLDRRQRPSTSSTAQNAALPEATLDESDPQRVQRWLLTTGLADLQARPETLDAYVRRLRMLRVQLQGWVINMIRQRAGRELADKVQGKLG